MELRYRNVNAAFVGIVRYWHHGAYSTRRRESRDGGCEEIDGPVTLILERPLERVLLNPARNPSPFLHLVEAMWMLAGRNDVAPLAYYVQAMKRFSDDGETLNGAYGYRWRNHRGHNWGRTGTRGLAQEKPVDQLDILVAHLKASPTSRRAVLSMWNVEDDLLKIGGTCGECTNGVQDAGPFDGTDVPCRSCGGRSVASRDTACNLSVCFSLRSEYAIAPGSETESKLLDMTVFNRSNDLLLGLLGANVVHFSVLLEYMASRLGAGVGRYTTVTNNLHVYDRDRRFAEFLAAARSEYLEPQTDGRVPLVRDPAAFEAEMPSFVEDNHDTGMLDPGRWTEPFLAMAQTVLNVYHARKSGVPHRVLRDLAESVSDPYWRAAVGIWLDNREKKETT